MDGRLKVDDREKQRKYLENNTGCILVSQSVLMSTGVNIPSLSKLVLFCGGKAEAKVIQSIGRILRLKDGKNAECIDVKYSSKYSSRHASQRKRMYMDFYNKKKFDKEITIKI